jgi:hypothetical protein
MLLIDRVICNFCDCYVGQLFNQPADQPHSINDLSLSPDFVVCPDCYESSAFQGDLCPIS